MAKTSALMPEGYGHQVDTGILLLMDHQRDTREAEVEVGRPTTFRAVLVHEVKAHGICQRQPLVSESAKDLRPAILLTSADRQNF